VPYERAGIEPSRSICYCHLEKRRNLEALRGDGFWIHRLLQDEGIESHVVDPASIATSRQRRWAKTDKIDGESLAPRPYWRINEANLECAPWFVH
jgi:transposase